MLPFLQRKIAVLVAAVGIVALIGPEAWAADQTVPAAVAVVVPISIANATGPDFGTVVKDNSVNCTFRLSPGSIETVTGGPCAVLDNGTAGSFDVNGDTGMTATVSAVVTNADCDGAGNVTLDSIILQTVPSDTDTRLGEPVNATFPVGATLTVNAAALPGTHNSCTFTITATYE